MNLDLQAKRIVINEILIRALQLHAVIDFIEVDTTVKKGFRKYSLFLDEHIIKKILTTNDVVSFELSFSENFSIDRESYN